MSAKVGPEELDPAVEIVHRYGEQDSGDGPDQPLAQAPIPSTCSTPSVPNHKVGVGVLGLREEARDVRGFVLTVGVEGHDVPGRGARDAGLDRGSVSTGDLVPEELHVRGPASRHVGGPVGGPVIDDDDLPACVATDRYEFVECARKRVLLVERRDHDCEEALGGGGCGLCGGIGHASGVMRGRFTPCQQSIRMPTSS